MGPKRGETGATGRGRVEARGRLDGMMRCMVSVVSEGCEVRIAELRESSKGFLALRAAHGLGRGEQLAPKQRVTGSSLVFRSKSFKR